MASRDEKLRYFDLVQNTRSTFRTICVESKRSQPCHLWQSFDQIFGRGRAPTADIGVLTLHQFFDEKLDAVRTTTSDAAPPSPFLYLTAVSSEYSRTSLWLTSLNC